MLFDLHNLAPAIGQVNAIRSNDRFAVIDDDLTLEEWPGCAVQHLRAEELVEHRFEPADCTKGDVARVWLYMHDMHGVVIPDDEWNMFLEWSNEDPVSPWELERDIRIHAIQGNHNPYVDGSTADEDGACPWEPDID